MWNRPTIMGASLEDISQLIQLRKCVGKKRQSNKVKNVKEEGKYISFCDKTYFLGGMIDYHFVITGEGMSQFSCIHIIIFGLFC